MKTLILMSLATPLFLVNLAFAQNLGKLSNETKPQNLVSSGEFLNYINSPADTDSNSHPLQSNNNLDSDSNSDVSVTRSDVRSHHGGYGRGYGYGYGSGWYGSGYWGSYYPSYYPSYYYPYYSYPYSSYYYPYYSYYLNDSNPGNSSSLSDSQPSADTHARGTHAPVDRAHAIVVCFAADASGNWFGSANLATQVNTSQELANHECLGSGLSCSQNLGCAIAYR